MVSYKGYAPLSKIHQVSPEFIAGGGTDLYDQSSHCLDQQEFLQI